MNQEFLKWRHYDHIILSQIYSSLAQEIMGQIIGHQKSHAIWIAQKKIFSTSSNAKIMQLILAFQTTRKRSLYMMEYILKLKRLLHTFLQPLENQYQRKTKFYNFLMVLELNMIQQWPLQLHMKMTSIFILFIAFSSCINKKINVMKSLLHTQLLKIDQENTIMEDITLPSPTRIILIMHKIE